MVNDDPERHQLARVDHSLCMRTIGLLMPMRNVQLPKTRASIRADLAYWIMCAKRARQTMRSTKP